MRFCLRYLHNDLELTEGQFVVGRSAGCQLSLDDPLVSRRHAALVITADAVTVEDLGSRNGVVVNGERISGKRSVAPGDRMVIGSQELTVIEVRESAPRGSASPLGNRTLPEFPAAADRLPVGEMGNIPVVTPREVDVDTSMVRRADAFNLLGSVAEKALAMGRADEAERLLSSALADVVEASRAGKRLSPWLVDMAAKFASKLATSTAKGTWADYVVELYDGQTRPCPGPVIDELYNAFRKINGVDLARLRAYLGHLRDKLATFGPAERFLIQRIEGLERLAALR